MDQKRRRPEKNRGIIDEDITTRGGYPRYVSSERWIFFKVLSFHSEMVTDLTILSLAVSILEWNECTWSNEVRRWQEDNLPLTFNKGTSTQVEESLNLPYQCQVKIGLTGDQIMKPPQVTLSEEEPVSSEISPGRLHQKRQSTKEKIPRGRRSQSWVIS